MNAESFSAQNYQELHELCKHITDTGKTPRIIGGGTGSHAKATESLLNLAGELATIQRISRENRIISVGCGASISKIKDALRENCLELPALTHNDEQVTIGGWLGSGMPNCRLRKPSTRILLSTSVYTPSGRLIRSGAPTPKDVAGYDFHRPLIGAQGQFGIMAEVTLSLVPAPERRIALGIISDDLQKLLYICSLMETCSLIWLLKHPDHRHHVLIELSGRETKVKSDSQYIKNTLDVTGIKETNDQDWSDIIKESFTSESDYLCSSVPPSRVIQLLKPGIQWGSLSSGSIWQRINNNMATNHQPTSVSYKRNENALYPTEIILSPLEQSYSNTL